MDTTEQYTDALRPICDAQGWDWSVKPRPRSRRISAEIKPGGAVIFLVPSDAPPASVAEFVRVKAGDIAVKIARSGTGPATKELVNGEGFPLLGTNHTLRIVTDAAEPATAVTVSTCSGATARELHVRRDSQQAMKRAIIAWYCHEGDWWARRRGREYEHRGNIAPLGYDVRDLGTRRWGFYHHGKHLLSLHWPLLQLPEELAMTTLVHELAHASHPGGKPHGPEWRRVMDRWLPGWRAREREQDRQGKTLWFGAIPHE